MKKGLTKDDSLAIKGMAILLMLFHHLFFNKDYFIGYDIYFTPLSQGLIVNFAILCKVCVSIFAFITGYGLVKSISKTELNRKSIAKWNVSRLIKTLSGFWFIYIIAFITTFFINRLPITQYFKKDNLNGVLYIILDFLGLANLFGTPTLCSTWWYMSAAIIFILIIPIIYAISKKIGYLPIVAIVIAAPRLLKAGYPGGLNTYTFILPVIFGMIFADYKLFEKITEKSPKNKAAAYILHFVVFFSILFSGYFIPYILNKDKIWEITYGVLPVIFICLFRYCIIRIPIIKNILQFLGEHSMTIFLTHTFMRYNYLTNFIYSRGHFLAIYIVLFVLSVALAYVLDILKKLCKYDMLIKKLTEKANKSLDKI